MAVMMHTSRSDKALLFGIACASASFIWLNAGNWSESQAQPKEGDRKWLGAGACLRCHTQGPTGADNDKFVLLTEYTTWRTQDKHALAYLALVGERGKQIGKLLGIDVTKPTPDNACLNCHSVNVPDSKWGRSFQLADGVSCDGCHGASSDWLGPHADDRNWRLKTAKEKATFGMIDLRDPATRTAVCAACHVGNVAEGKVITHAMYAAGHPPLPAFEVATFSRRLPQHWRDRRDVPFFEKPPEKDREVVRKVYHMDSADYQQTQLALASSVAGLANSLKYASERSNLAAGEQMNAEQSARRWPETKLAGFADLKLPALWPQLAMGQADCYACHHELQRPSWRQLRGYSGPPGRPQLAPWNTMLARQGLGIGDGEAELRKRTAAVHAACNARPFGDPEKLSQASGELAAWAVGRLTGLDLPDAKPDRLELLRRLCALEPQQFPDYDSARQIAAAFVSIYSEEFPKTDKNSEAGKALAALDEQFHLNTVFGRRERLLLIKAQLEQITGQKVLTKPGALEAVEFISTRSLDEAFPQKTTDKDKQALGKSVRDFLSDVQRNGERLTADLAGEKSSDFLTQMSALNERELATALGKLNDYDPIAFKKRLEALAALLKK
jgi:hypothetical protein